MFYAHSNIYGIRHTYIKSCRFYYNYRTRASVTIYTYYTYYMYTYYTYYTSKDKTHVTDRTSRNFKIYNPINTDTYFNAETRMLVFVSVERSIKSYFIVMKMNIIKFDR